MTCFRVERRACALISPLLPLARFCAAKSVSSPLEVERRSQGHKFEYAFAKVACVNLPAEQISAKKIQLKEMLKKDSGWTIGV